MASPREAREGDNSIVFLGQVGAAQSFKIAETQSIWAAAYLTGKLRLPSVDEMEMDIALTNVWRRRRYLSAGERKPVFMHDELAVTLSPTLRVRFCDTDVFFWVMVVCVNAPPRPRN